VAIDRGLQAPAEQQPAEQVIALQVAPAQAPRLQV
jgi:hypothetical protein